MENNKFLACFGLVVLGVLAIVVSSLVGGWVLSILWGWFVVPIFHAPALPIGYAIGIGLVVSLLTHDNSRGYNEKASESKWEKFIYQIAMALVAPLITLLFAWIVRLLMI